MQIIIADLRAAGLSEAQILQVVEAADIRLTEKRHAQLREASRKYRARRHQNHDDNHERDDRGSLPFFLTSLPSSATSLEKEERLEIVALGKKWPRDYREQFWTAYPKKVEKPYALKCLEKVMRSGVEFSALMAGVARIDRTDPKYIKNPSTWLNRGCWTDGEGVTEGPIVNHALLEEHRRQCLLGGSDGNAQAEIRRDTGLGEAGSGDVAELRSSLRVVRGKDQTVGGQLAVRK